MPLFYKKDINTTTSLAIWKIEEPEAFFLDYVSLKSNITHPQKRLQHLAGRYLLQYLFPHFPINNIHIADTGKPYLESGQYQFSISHSGEYAAAIVSTTTQRTGIDLEIVRPKVSKIAHRFLNQEEIIRLIGEGIDFKSENLTQIQSKLLPKLAELTLYWCAKETIFKWWGIGDVNFSEMIRIDHFTIETNGIMKGRFIKGGITQSINLGYHVFNSLCLVWLSENW